MNKSTKLYKSITSLLAEANKILEPINNLQLRYLQPVITQYFVRNKSEICHRPLRVHSKG